MRNRIFKYFFISLLILIGGVFYFVMVNDNRIIVKQIAEPELQPQQATEAEQIKSAGNQSASSLAAEDKKDNSQMLNAGKEGKTKRESEKYRNLGKEQEISEQSTVDSTKTVPETKGKININTADKKQLMTLKGIGEKKAEQIIEYRTKKGNFQKIEDIMKIKGIKRKAFEKIKDFICVSD